MEAKLRARWQKAKRPLAVIGLIVALVVVIVLIFIEVKLYGTGFSGKTLWEWLQLLIIPAVLAVGGYAFTYTTSRNERAATEKRTQAERDISLDNQREAVLQDYIDKMAELLLKDHLSELKPEYKEVRKIARVRTLTVLPRLNGNRKGSVLQFLYESNLIDRDNPIVDLNGADLSHADLGCVNWDHTNLRRANLRKANLWGACLDDADLSHANLREADLRAFLMRTTLKNAQLQKADLRGSVLTGTDLTFANLRNADLYDTDLSFTDLTGIQGITVEELKKKARSLQGATMPDGSKHP